MSTGESATSTPGPTIEPPDERGGAVRFESQCVVIPDPAHWLRRPRVVTKSYALPLWKRRASSASPSTSAPPEDTSFDDNQSHLVLRVPLPIFSLKPRPMARSVDDTPLPPCLVHHPQHLGSAPRRARTPRKPSLSPSRSDIVTVPLRPCCTACQSVAEAALVDGDAWPERFSRAASRRRSRSADCGSRTITVAGSAASASYGDLGVSINVDEIDQRRRSSDTGLSISNQESLWSNDGKAKGMCRTPSIHRRAAASNSSVTDPCSPSPTRVIPTTPRIPEEEDDEDENELFPLPSPKRTPTTSPSPSPAGSLSSLMAAQANQSFVSSPTPSTCSGDSAGLHPNKRHFLAPPPCSSSSSLSLPKLSESTTDLALSEDPPRVPSPSLLSTLPTLSGRLRSRSSSPRISFVPPTPTDALPSATDSTSSKTSQLPKPLPEPTPITIPSSPGSSQLSTFPHQSPLQTRFPWRSKRSASASVISLMPSSPTSSFSPPTSPTLSTSSSSTKRSFSMSNPRHIIADVLRGVGAMGSSGIIGPGM
ncbi:hypothetical protein J3R83DRAFT_7320 [Lanmaoa asiatica]|nr:hypothetical protein J3R83DRAFT_7320 [Lanmaoa asiatica]